jgi:hypothetical protein
MSIYLMGFTINDPDATISGVDNCRVEKPLAIERNWGNNSLPWWVRRVRRYVLVRTFPGASMRYDHDPLRVPNPTLPEVVVKKTSLSDLGALQKAVFVTSWANIALGKQSLLL